jgi:hypothetical protein
MNKIYCKVDVIGKHAEYYSNERCPETRFCLERIQLLSKYTGLAGLGEFTQQVRIHNKAVSVTP